MSNSKIWHKHIKDSLSEPTLAEFTDTKLGEPSNVPPKPGFKDIPVGFTLNDERDLS